MNSKTYSGKLPIFKKDFKVFLNLIAPYIREFQVDLIKEAKKKKKSKPKGTEQKLSNLGNSINYLSSTTSKGQRLKQDYKNMSPPEKISLDRFINSLPDKPKDLAELIRFIVLRAKIQRTRKEQEDSNEKE